MEEKKEALKKILAKMSGEDPKELQRAIDYLNEIAEVYQPGGSGGTSAKKAVVYVDDLGYYTSLTFECKDETIETYSDLLNYLKAEGYVRYDAVNPDKIASLSCSGLMDGSAVVGIFVDNDGPESPEKIGLITTNGIDSWDDVTQFDITFLGNE